MKLNTLKFSHCWAFRRCEELKKSSCHSREGGNLSNYNFMSWIGSRLRGNDSLIFQLLATTILLFTTATYAAAQQTYPFTSSTEAARFQSLTKEIRCVVCQNQSIADSNAPLANDLREKVYKMVLANETNEEIKTYLVKRYGEFILLQPRFNKFTVALWMFPLLGLMLIVFIFYHYKKTLPQTNTQ